MKTRDVRQPGKTDERRRPVADFSRPDRGNWLAGLLLVAAIALAYQPAFRAGFIWDDDKYVTQNELITASDGLKRIWFSRDSPSQYFPLTYTTFRLEHALWGFHPAGYHAVNILLHALNALLLWRLLRSVLWDRRFAAASAWLAAAVFALHPVQVESVAWITERKNLLSLFFSLLTLLAWWGFVQRRPSAPGRYAAALCFFALALFSKTTACTLPAAMLAMLWLNNLRIDRGRLMSIAPFVLMGVVMGLVTVWWERTAMGTSGELFAMNPLERLLVASRAVWFYAAKLLWPVNLAFSYPRWNIDPSDPFAYAWLLAGIGLCVAVWKARRFLGRGPESALFFYVATLAPLLGVFMLYTFRYTFVADHYQYVACIGPIALAAAGLARFLNSRASAAVVGGALLLVLGTLTWRQCRTYIDAETLWRTTIERNPESFLARNNLGVLLSGKGRVDEAIVQFEAVVKAQPNDADSRFNLGNCWVFKGRLVEAVAHYQKALELDPRHSESHNALAVVLFQQGRTGDAIVHWQRVLELNPHDAATARRLAETFLKLGRVEEAVVHFEKALAIDPELLPAQNNLAWILATCPKDSVRNGARAVELAERANAACGDDPVVLSTLAAAYAEAGRFADALTAARKARDLAAGANNADLAKAIDVQMAAYAANLPFREGN